MNRQPDMLRKVAGGALRRHREQRGLSLHDAARILDCDPSKISRIENGIRGIRARELRVLLSEYGLPEPGRQTLLDLACPAGQRWWDDFPDVVSDEMAGILALEHSAARIAVWSPLRVPELLQTAEYACAMARGGMPAPGTATAERIRDFFLARQDAAIRAAGTPLHAVIGEGALHQHPGDAAVMRQQLTALAGCASDGTGLVTVQVLPFNATATAATGTGPMSVLSLGTALSPGLVLAGGPGGVHCLISRDEVQRCTAMFAQLAAAALTPAQSADLIGQVADRAPAR
jgi:transcriptional regulator with XRE-family HTH domain